MSGDCVDLHIGDLDMLKNHAWCNFEFLLARLHSSSVHALISDLDLTSASALDPDIHLVLHSVIASTRVLAVDPLQLANELIGRLRPLKGNQPLTPSGVINILMLFCLFTHNYTQQLACCLQCICPAYTVCTDDQWRMTESSNVCESSGLDAGLDRRVIGSEALIRVVRGRVESIRHYDTAYSLKNLFFYSGQTTGQCVPR